MNASLGQCRWLAAYSLLLVGLLPLAGCSALAGAMYVIKGHNVAAEFKQLEKKRVAVVCRPPTTLVVANAGVNEALAEELSNLLGQRVPGIDMVDYREVAEWTDENQWDDFAEIGEAVDAQMVVGIELERFSLYEGQLLYKGRAKVGLKVLDMEQGGKIVFRKVPPASSFPPNTEIPTDAMSEEEFRRTYLSVLADEIGRHFYDHDPYADIALDGQAY